MSQLITELLELQATVDLRTVQLQLLENLGNLTQVDKNLLKALRKEVSRYDHSSPGQYGLEPRKTQAIDQNLGRGSQVVTNEPIKTITQALEKLDAPGRMAMIVKIDDEQVLLIANVNRLAGDTKTNKGGALMIATEKLLQTIPKQDYLKALDPSSKYTTRMMNVFTSGTQDTWSKVQILLRTLVAKAKEQEKTVEYMYITLDSERKQLAAKREKDRQGMVPVPKDPRQRIISQRFGRLEGAYKSYIDMLKSDLKQRLDKFKGAKTPDVGNVDNLLKTFIEQGYLDKVRFMGKVYNFDRDYINFSKLRSGSDSDYDKSYITYKREGGMWDEETYEIRSNLRKEMKEKVAGGANLEQAEAEYQQQLEELMKKTAPPEIKIFLTLEGGRIVPKEVTLSTGY